MKIELKNFKHAAFASEETLCFEATVYVDGKKLGEASNNGRGGCTSIYVAPENREWLKQVEAYCLTLPGVKVDETLLPMDFDFLIDTLAVEKVNEKQLKSAMRNKIIIAKPEAPGEIFEVSLRKGVKLTPAIIDEYQLKNPTYLILNTMPLGEALKLYAV